MDIYTEAGIRSDRRVSAHFEPDGSLRIDQVDSGDLTEELTGDWDYERILTIEDPIRLIPYLMREGFVGSKLTFDRIKKLAGEAGCEVSYWAW